MVEPDQTIYEPSIYAGFGEGDESISPLATFADNAGDGAVLDSKGMPLNGDEDGEAGGILCLR